MEAALLSKLAPADNAGAGLAVRRMKTMTSVGSCLSSDDMVVRKGEEQEEEKAQNETVNARPMMGAEFKRRGKEAFEGLILRQRFEDTADRRILFKRRDDWIKNLNLNLVKGKVIKSTHYFDELAPKG